MHAFCDFVQGLVDSHDERGVIRAFQFAERVAYTGNSDLANALMVSFLEHLNLKDDRVARSWAKSLMPTSLAQLYAGAVEYNARPLGRGAT